MNEETMQLLVAEAASQGTGAVQKQADSETGQPAYAINGRIYCVVPEEQLQNLLDKYDSARLRLSQIASLASGEEAWPSEVVEAMTDGVHPLRVIRKYRGMTTTELAAKVGVSQGHISEIETGKKEGSLRLLVRLADTLHVDLDELVPSSHFRD